MKMCAAQANAFYAEVLANETVWSVKDSGGFPAPANSDGHRSMPFWSQQSRGEAAKNAGVARNVVFERLQNETRHANCK
jgi:hypothetical protein